MSTYLLIFAATMLLSLLLTRAVRDVARRGGMLDQPDGQRKLQVRAVPLGGGIAVFFTFLAASLAALYWLPELALPLATLTFPLLLSAGCICLLGAVDDIHNLNGRLKLLLQIACVVPLVAAGMYIENVSICGYVVHLGWFGVPLTVLWLITCINAMNLLDGMDGMASVVGIIAALTLAAIAMMIEHTHVAVLAVALAGAISGFLYFNKPPASIYLGDAGSTTIGLLLGVLSIRGSVAPGDILLFPATVVVLTVPIFDTTLAVVRRKLTGRTFDAADRGHIHHRLLELGMTTRQALGVTALVCATAGCAAIVAVAFRSDVPAIFITLGLIAAMIQLRLFGQYEVSLVILSTATVLASWTSRLFTTSSANSRTIAHRLDKLPFDEAWRLCIEEASHWHARRLELVVKRNDGTQSYHAWSDSAEQASGGLEWTLTVQSGDANGSTCELLVSGYDPQTSCPSYLMPLTTCVETFSSHWARHARDVPATQIRRFDDGSGQVERRAA